MSDQGGKPRYTREEMAEILRRAAERTHGVGGSAGDDVHVHDDLIAAAREVGIDVSAVEEAALQVDTDREDRRAVETWIARRKRRFESHALTWLVVCMGLFLLNLASGGPLWAVYPAIGWGMAVAMHAIGTFRTPTPERAEKIARRERRRREAEARRRSKREARERLRKRWQDSTQRRRDMEREFERVVEAGVTALMSAAARRLEQHNASRPDTEFNRYVDRAERRGSSPPPFASERDTGREGRGPRVRVGEDGSRDHDELEHESERERERQRRR